MQSNSQTAHFQKEREEVARRAAALQNG